MKHALINRTVEQNAHKSMLGAKKSCDEIILRVKRDALFNCSIDLLFASVSDKRRSITELTTEPHSRKAHRPTSADHAAACSAMRSETPRSCAFASVSGNPDYSDAGSIPAFLLRAPAARCGVRSAEFISVSGQCAARSAHYSDLRIKRISGGVAATEHLHAPMNSPTDTVFKTAARRVSFSTSALTCIEGDSSWL